MVDKNKAREFVDPAPSQLKGAAGETFKGLMKDKQLDAIDLKRVETQIDWLNSQEKKSEG
jgi:hypothetical protein